VSHHGWYQSSSPALVEAIHPRVAIMDNGANKGGSIPTFKTLAAATDLSGKPTQLWQLHYSNEAKDLNRPDKFLANVPGSDMGNFIKLTASPNGSFIVLNSRTGFAETYKPVR
jgi:competence protein ComEC